MSLEPTPGTSQPMRGSGNAKLIITLLEPILGFLEGDDGLSLCPRKNGGLAQTQQQGSSLALLCGKEREGDAIVLHGIFKGRGLPRLLGSTTSVVCSSSTVTTLGEVEGQIGEVLRTSLVGLSFQNPANKAMQATSSHGGDLGREALAHFIVAEGKSALRILTNEPRSYCCQQRLLDGFCFLTGHLCEEGHIEGAPDQCSCA